MNPRNLCRCGHVRNSHHDDGPCGTRGAGCSCPGFSPAYRIFDDRLPDGVAVLRDYRNGLSLIECSHSNEHRRGSMCEFCKGDDRATSAFVLRVKALAFVPRELTLL